MKKFKLKPLTTLVGKKVNIRIASTTVNVRSPNAVIAKSQEKYGKRVVLVDSVKDSSTTIAINYRIQSRRKKQQNESIRCYYSKVKEVSMAQKKRKPKLGSGERFKEVAAAAAASGAEDPNAVAAAAGRKKYGKKKMAAMAAAGRKRAAKRK